MSSPPQAASSAPPAPPAARRITTLTDVKVMPSSNGLLLRSAVVRTTPVSGVDLFGTADAVTSNCSSVVLDRLETVLEIDASPPVKWGIFLAIFWWERNWCCDSEWELPDGPEHWDAAAVELLERLFV